MAEIELINRSTAPLLLAALFESGDPGPIASAFAQVPEICELALPYIGASLGAGSVGVRRKELVILRTSAMLSCRYCVAAHSVVAIDVGLTFDEVRALRNEMPIDDAFADAQDRGLIRWIDAVAAGRGPVDPLVTAGVKAFLADYEIVELANTLGVTMLLNRFCTALDLPTSEATIARLNEAGLAA